MEAVSITNTGRLDAREAKRARIENMKPSNFRFWDPRPILKKVKKPHKLEEPQ